MAPITPRILDDSNSTPQERAALGIAYIACVGVAILGFIGVGLVVVVRDCRRKRRAKQRARQESAPAPAPARDLYEIRSWPGWKMASKEERKENTKGGRNDDRTSQTRNTTRGSWPSPFSSSSSSSRCPHNSLGSKSLWSERYAANPNTRSTTSSTTIISSIPLYAWETVAAPLSYRPHREEEEEEKEEEETGRSIMSSRARTGIAKSEREDDEREEEKEEEEEERVNRTATTTKPVEEENRENIFVAFAGFLRSWAMVEGSGRRS